MKDVSITITSKNQVTLPIDFVRMSNLRKGNKLSARVQGSKLILEPMPSVEQVMAPAWNEMRRYVKAPLSDKGVKQAIRAAAARGAWGKER